MAVVLFHKDGKSIKVEPDMMHSYLSSKEWFLTKDETEKQENPEETETKKEKVLISEDAVRKIAKEKGIKHWHNKNIERLRKEVDEWLPAA